MSFTLGEFWEHERMKQERSEGMKDMDFSEFQHKANETAIYPDKGELGGLVYTALGLAGEGGEVANKVKKILRDDADVLTDERKSQIEKEIGGVLWYCAQLATELGTPLGEIARQNIEILASRSERGTLTGSGDER